MTETVLFVGGSKDGERAYCRPNETVMQFQELREGALVETYGKISCPKGREYPVYLISTESPDNLIPLLIEGYRKAKE